MASTSTHTLPEIRDHANDGYNHTSTKSAYLDKLSEVYDDRYSDPVFGGAKLIARSETVSKIIKMMENFTSQWNENPQHVEDVRLLNDLLSTYKVLDMDGQKKLVRKRANSKKIIVKVLGFEEAFDILDKTHRKYGHCNGAKLEELLKEENQIPEKCYQLFPECCNVCQKNSCFGKIVRVTLIREKMQAVLLYQDVWSNYSLLRTINAKNRHRDEVTIELLKIFTDFGIPDKMIVSPTRDFYMSVLEELNKFLPCAIYVEKMKHYDRFSHQEVVNKILKMLESWKTSTKSQDYTFGCYAVQVQWNNTKPDENTDCPYKKVFGELNMGKYWPLNISSENSSNIEKKINWPFNISSKVSSNIEGKTSKLPDAEEIPTIELD